MATPVEQIKSRLSVADVVGSYLKITRAGANFKAVCPFHNEKTPSFFISPARDVWHCFGCGKGGDQFRFVMDIEGVDFKEALHILAERAGVTVTYERPEERSERERLFALMEEAAVFYEKNLTRATMVRQYVDGRGVTEETAKKFRIGFSLPTSEGWRTLLEYLRQKGYRDEEAEKVGLVIRNPKSSNAANRYYDRFRSRIMFPITDANGRVIAFGGRIYGNAPEGTAKYINSPQTLLYDKSRVLYAFDKAKLAMRKENAAILVEGYMDAVMAHQAGTEHVVAVSGTALTREQLEMLRRLCRTLVMAFDTDEAGESATRRSIDLAIEGEFDVRIIAMEEKDPADVVKDNPAEWLRAVGEAKDIITFFLERSLAKYDRTALEGKRKIVEAVLPFVARIPREIDKAHWVGKIASALDVKEEAVWSDVRRLRREGGSFITSRVGSEYPKKEVPEKSRLEKLEEHMLGLFLLRPAEVAELVAHDTFTMPTYKDVYEKMLESRVGSGGWEAALAGLAPEYRTLADRFAFEAEVMVDSDIGEEARTCAAELSREKLRRRLGELSQSIRTAESSGDVDKATLLMGEFAEVSRRLAGK